jgi:23S rRNA pseudouridine2605 synthase
MAERLQKWLANAGLGSRREVERWTAAGRITIDGRTARLGDKVTGDERILLDGRPVPKARHASRPEVLLYHKPTGEICSRSDPQGRPTVFAGLPRLKTGRWISVGRLDVATSGLLIFTTDGHLADRLMRPSSGLEREYAVRVAGDVAAEAVASLRRGVQLEDGVAHFERIEFAGGEGTNRWYRVVVSEGRNRLVRRLWEAAGLTVSRLIRIRFGAVRLPRDLRRGQTRPLRGRDVALLYRAVGLTPPGGASHARK